MTMELIIMFLVLVGMYLLGYIVGFMKCEEITDRIINQIIEECEEKKIHHITKEGNKWE